MDIKVVTVLGANGAMGKNISAIFASFGHAKVYLACRSEEKARQAVVDAYNSIRSESIQDLLIPITYDNIEEAITKSDLIFESLSEDFEIKKNMYKQIRPYIKKDAIIATGTSGLSVKELSMEFENNSNNFFGIHMFNPPYNLTLCELITHSEEQKETAKILNEYLSNNLNRTVIQVKDTPGFLGNRIGFYFINEALKLANDNREEGGIDYIDTILGCFTGRTMPPLATADFVGLDVSKAIINYINSNINDEFNDSFELPKYCEDLVKNGYIGKKVEKGLFYKNNNESYVYDIKSKEFRPRNNYQFYFSNEIIKNIKCGKYEEAINVLLNDKSHEATICKKMILQYIIYSLYTANEVTFDIQTCDDAMATGFSWLPPIAWIEILGGKKRLLELAKEYLEDKYVNILENDDLFQKIPNKSKYDFRPFIKAKY